MSTLMELLETLGTKTVRIGAKEGSGFVYIGPADKTDEMALRFVEYRESTKKHLQVNTGKLINTCKSEPKQREDETILDANLRYSGEVAKLRTLVINAEKYLNTYVGLWDRKIMSVDESDDPEHINETIIVVSGYENGKFWYKHEYDEMYS